jgi:dynein heavy chain 2, cytosolic
LPFQDAGTQKSEMEQLALKVNEETIFIERQKQQIDSELAETQPLVDQAKQAVSSLRPETLVEIRSLRAPPDVIKDILEGVLKLMGVLDTSWTSMKAYANTNEFLHNEWASFDLDFWVNEV